MLFHTPPLSSIHSSTKYFFLLIPTSGLQQRRLAGGRGPAPAVAARFHVSVCVCVSVCASGWSPASWLTSRSTTCCLPTVTPSTRSRVSQSAAGMPVLLTLPSPSHCFSSSSLRLKFKMVNFLLFLIAPQQPSRRRLPHPLWHQPCHPGKPSTNNNDRIRTRVEL